MCIVYNYVYRNSYIGATLPTMHEWLVWGADWVAN